MIVKRSVWAAFKIASKQNLINTTSKFDFSFGDQDFGNVENAFDNTKRSENYQRTKTPFNEKTFAIFTKFTKSEAMEEMHKSKGSYSTEEFLVQFFDSIKTREGYIAWSQLTEAHREQFVDNLLMFIQDSLDTQTRMSISQFSRTMFSFLIQSNSYELVKKFLSGLFGSIRSVPIKYNIINGMLLGSKKAKKTYSSEVFQESVSLCENLLFEILNDSRTRIDGRSIPGISHALANYLEYVSNSNFIKKSVHLDFLANYYISLPLGEIPPMSMVVGYSSIIYIMNSSRVKLNFSHQSDNLNIMQNCFTRYLSADKNRQKEGNDSMFEEQDVESEPVDAVIDAIYIHKFVQAYFIENEENWVQKTGLLYAFSHRSGEKPIDDAFKKWIQKQYQTDDFNFTNGQEFEQVFMIIGTFLRGNGYQKLKLKLLGSSIQFLNRMKDPARFLDMLNFIGPFKSLIPGAPYVPNPKFEQEKEYSNEHKDVVVQIFEICKAKLMDESLNMSLGHGLKVITFLKGGFNALTIEELKSSKIHKTVWPKVQQLPQFRRLIIEVFQALQTYDLVNDKEMQETLGFILEKLFSQENVSKNKSKFSFHAQLVKTIQTFESSNESLSQEAKVLLQKMTDLRSRLESD